jgi:hypothetical protein
MTKIEFIDEFNKYKINNITFDEYEYLQNMNMHRKLEKIEKIEDRKFIVYENLYFVYDKKVIDKLTFIIINDLIDHKNFTEYNNTVIKYIYMINIKY